VCAVALARELSAVDANDRDVIRISLFELPQLRKYVDAVDSAVSPEVEQQEFAAKIGEAKSAAAGVNPVERVREVGSAYGGAIH
jgi:hypothetical protein